MSDFDIDLVTGPRRSARIAWLVAGCSVIVSVLLAIVLVVLLPLRSTEVFTVLVDSTTGAAERIYQVQPTGIEDAEAMKQALLVAYVNDRESYFRAGIQERLESVRRRSAGQARRTLVELWSEDSESYPPRVYGPGAQVDVEVRSITFFEPEVARVRFTKILQRPNRDTVRQSFVATVEFDFRPRQERSLERVWENPLGFEVTSYRVDAETLNGGSNG
ncbi:type IV secretion system protein VirB8 [Palleronia aestuarii]|uniref:Type IV secretion system protein VirB8 n=1 Tax=Palleronia aestuarii TaxID=568105 RepID=A0A2W7MXW6_9RHOB|nr:type IV secretion system protein [Palleronia aestuarii]PZX12451.1 type IV secretion system protein VirB8 [Palleronia aestuarii]